MLIPKSSKRQFNWVSDVFYFMKKSALVFELCYFKDTWLYFMSQNNENLVILEFKDLQNKKWQKQAVKSARTKKSYRTY